MVGLPVRGRVDATSHHAPEKCAHASPLSLAGSIRGLSPQKGEPNGVTTTV
jgi:hypothetical protein